MAFSQVGGFQPWFLQIFVCSSLYVCFLSFPCHRCYNIPSLRCLFHSASSFNCSDCMISTQLSLDPLTLSCLLHSDTELTHSVFSYINEFFYNLFYKWSMWLLHFLRTLVTHSSQKVLPWLHGRITNI